MTRRKSRQTIFTCPHCGAMFNADMALDPSYLEDLIRMLVQSGVLQYPDNTPPICRTTEES